MGRPLLERDYELAVLTAAVEEAGQGKGSVVLVQGEAGIGKSSLIAALRDRLGNGTRLLVGRCDDLALPRILGPFRDLVGAVGPEVAAALRDPVDRDEMLTALRGP
jgi:predicted ATPase